MGVRVAWRLDLQASGESECEDEREDAGSVRLRARLRERLRLKERHRERLRVTVTGLSRNVTNPPSVRVRARVGFGKTPPTSQAPIGVV
jgi:hypothetical protein